MKRLCLLGGLLAALFVVASAVAQAPAGAPAGAPTGVVVVLGGGGAKGFAHLAVLRQLEADRVPIARIVGTSMGAVIGGLYASGLGLDEIERVIGTLDPAQVALDQIDRSELNARARAYQKDFPIDLEFGVGDQGLGFARGASDGQRFMALLQRLLVHVDESLPFDRLPIPFRAVATRYRDGEAQVFDRGSLALAIRASMAAPGVFAPLELGGESYVDGGLVANIPVGIALREPAAVLVVSALLDRTDAKAAPSMGNALAIANQMINILIHQNERRDLALLRPQDVLVNPELKDVLFADFNRAAEIVRRGEAAITQVAPAWQRMVARMARPSGAPATRKLALDQRDVVLKSVRVSGLVHFQAEEVSRNFAELMDRPFDQAAVAARIEALYASGNFEQVSYGIEQLQDDRYALLVRVVEKPYAPNFLKASLGFSTEVGGINQFSVGLGYRRPDWTSTGAELGAELRLGTNAGLGVSLRQPLAPGWALTTALSAGNVMVPLYESSFSERGRGQARRMAYYSDQRLEWNALLNFETAEHSVLRLGLLAADQRYELDVARPLALEDGRTLTLQDLRFRYGAARLQWVTDRLDSLSFPTRGYGLNLLYEKGLTRQRYSRVRVSAQLADGFGPHILGAGLNFARDAGARNCGDDCESPTSLYLGGFQLMGAYHMGELMGDRLAHVYASYMYRLSEGGILRQPIYLGLMLERGDAWFSFLPVDWKNSLTLFAAIDSKIGDIYIGAGRGSRGANNFFLQLGRRFSF